MYIFKNALKSITRIKGRSILIGIVVLIIATSSCVALSIKNSASSLVESYKSENEVEAKITLDRSKMRNDMKENGSTTKPSNPQDFMANISEINMDMVKQYADSSYVKSYTYSLSASANVSSIEKVTMENSTTSTQNSSNSQNQMKQKGPEMEESTKNTGDFKLVGYGDLNSMTEFIDSTYTITSGSVFDTSSSDNVCLISDELAEKNSLSVGSTITVVNPNDESIKTEFKIVGIYKDNSESDEFSMFSNSANKILTTYTALNNFVSLATTDTNKISTQTNATFILKDQDSVNPFLSEIQSKGLSEYYTLTTNVDSINESIKPIENLNSFATIFLIIVLLIGGGILMIVNMINIRERKYEIGVLRAIGMKKMSVLFQFIAESFMVTFAGIILGIVIGSVVSVPIANKLLASQIQTQQESQSKVSQNFGMQQGDKNNMGNMPGNKDINSTFSNNSSKYVDKINALINIQTIGELMLIGIALTLVSSSISMIFVARYSPLKILSNRT